MQEMHHQWSTRDPHDLGQWADAHVQRGPARGRRRRGQPAAPCACALTPALALTHLPSPSPPPPPRGCVLTLTRKSWVKERC
eukprot:4372410-Prymnesium_polylepis.1